LITCDTQREKKNQFDFDNVYIYQDIDVPDADRIKSLESMKSDESFENQYGHSDKKGALHEALWTCQHLFSHLPKSVAYKRIFLFTNDDDPFQGDAALRKKCMERVKDLMGSEIMIELFVLKGQSEHFDPTKFWQHILYRSEDDYNGQIYIDGAKSFQQLRDGVRRKTFTKRALQSFDLELGNSGENSVALSVSMYNMVHKATKNSATFLHSGTNRPVKCETKYICEDTGSELMQSDINYYFEYGGSKAIFDKEDILKLRTFGSKGMKLMGFKPRSRLKVYQNICSSGFVYPKDGSISGSSSAFSALHKKMLEMNKIAICRFIARERSPPIFVALVPQEEEFDQDDPEIQLQPPGFQVVYLPYADGIRKLDEVLTKNKDPELEITQKQIDKAKILIKKLNVDMKNAEFDNPGLQKHYATLKALALEHDKEDPIQDHMQPDYEGMKKYQNLLEEFKDAVYSANYVPSIDAKKGRAAASTSTSKPAPKRKRSVKEEEADEDEESTSKKKSKQPAKKRMKKEAAADDDEGEEIDIVQLAKDNKLNSLTVPTLKEFCKLYSLKPGGKGNKPDLIAAITDFLKTKKKL
jgi:ATP-dependent DNA helicase 2 subunit 1